MKKSIEVFVDHWHQISVIWSEIALTIAVIMMLYYLIRLVSQKSLTKKHEFIIVNEIKYLWYVGISLAVGFSFFLNALLVRAHYTGSYFALSIKTFVSVMLGLLIGSVLNTYLHVYYPFRMERRLHRIRFKTRKSATSGDDLILLTEDEEDVHLTDEMIEHENMAVYEYDVWLDEKTGTKLIEKYRGNHHLIICEKCNYRTSHEYQEKVEEEPTASQSGTLMKYYRCSHCDHMQQRTSTIAALSSNM